MGLQLGSQSRGKILDLAQTSGGGWLQLRLRTLVHANRKGLVWGMANDRVLIDGLDRPGGLQFSGFEKNSKRKLSKNQKNGVEIK
jgi:hypothetical protein